MGWDKGVDYEFVYNKILKRLVEFSTPARCYDAIPLLQLRNGVRISEAVKAFKHFLTSKSIEFEVEVSKKKRVERRKNSRAERVVERGAWILRGATQH